MGGSYEDRRDELRRRAPVDAEAARAARVAIRQAMDAATIETAIPNGGAGFIKSAMHIGRVDALIEAATGGDKAKAMRIASLARVHGLLPFLSEEYVSAGDVDDDISRMRDRFEPTLNLLIEWECAGPAGDKARDDEEPVEAPPEQIDIDAKLIAAVVKLKGALDDIGAALRREGDA